MFKTLRAWNGVVLFKTRKRRRFHVYTIYDGENSEGNRRRAWGEKGSESWRGKGGERWRERGESVEEEGIFEACDEKKARGECSEKKEKAEREREKKAGHSGPKKSWRREGNRAARQVERVTEQWKFKVFPIRTPSVNFCKHSNLIDACFLNRLAEISWLVKAWFSRYDVGRSGTNWNVILRNEFYEGMMCRGSWICFMETLCCRGNWEWMMDFYRIELFEFEFVIA